MQLESCLSDCLQQSTLLKEHALKLYVLRNQHYALARALQMLSAPEKSLLFEEVREILDFLEELELCKYTVYSKVKALYDQ